MAAEKKRSAAVSVGGGVGVEVIAILRRLGIVIIAGKRRGHSDHLYEADDRAENYSAKVKPVSVKPVIPETAECVSQKNCRRNDEANFGIARRGDQSVRRFSGCVFCSNALVSFFFIVFGHDGLILYRSLLSLMNQLGHRRIPRQTERPVHYVDEAVRHDSYEQSRERSKS